MSDNDNLSLKNPPSSTPDTAIMETLIQENNSLRNWQSNEIGLLCERVKKIKNVFDSLDAAQSHAPQGASPDNQLKKRNPRNLSPKNSEIGYHNAQNTELRKLREELDIAKKENRYFKLERKQCQEIMKLQNRVIQDLGKNWEELNLVLREYKKNGNSKVNSLFQNYFGNYCDKSTTNHGGADPPEPPVEPINKNESSTLAKPPKLSNLIIQSDHHSQTPEKVEKSTQMTVNRKSVGVQTFRGDELWKNDWVQLKKKQKLSNQKIDQMVKLVNAAITTGVTSKYKSPHFFSSFQNESLQIPQTHNGDSNLGQMETGHEDMNPKHNHKDNSYTSESSDDGLGEGPENLLEKNFTLNSSDGRTTYTCETLDRSNN